MTSFSNFKGAAKRLDNIDLPLIGRQIGVGEDELHAFMEAETRGTGFDDQGRPRILFERHKFYKYVPEKKRAAAVKAGLANVKAGGYGKESEQYGKLARAMAIDQQAALLSCSWGLAQVMGFNFKHAGYDSVDEMILSFMADEENHLQAAVNFIKNSGLDDELRRHDWKGFAKGYNGTGYAINKYDQKLAAAYAKWAKIKDTPIPGEAKKSTPAKAPVAVENGVLKLQAATPSIRTDKTTVEVVQSRLYELGYTEVGSKNAKTGRFDGIIGKMTKTAILAFRNENDLPVSDVIDDQLLEALDSAKGRTLARSDATAQQVRAVAPEVQSNWLTKLGAAGGAGALGIGGIGKAALDYISPWKDAFADIPGWFWLGGVILFLAVIAYIAWRGEKKGIQAYQEGARR